MVRIGAEKISDMLRDHFAPEAADSAYREAAWFLQFKRTDQTADVCLVGFDALRRKAESQMQMSGATPESLVAALRAQDANLPRFEKPAALAREPELQGSCKTNEAITCPARRSCSAGCLGGVPSGEQEG